MPLVGSAVVQAIGVEARQAVDASHTPAMRLTHHPVADGELVDAVAHGHHDARVLVSWDEGTRRRRGAAEEARAPDLQVSPAQRRSPHPDQHVLVPWRGYRQLRRRDRARLAEDGGPHCLRGHSRPPLWIRAEALNCTPVTNDVVAQRFQIMLVRGGGDAFGPAVGWHRVTCWWWRSGHVPRVAVDRSVPGAT